MTQVCSVNARQCHTLALQSVKFCLCSSAIEQWQFLLLLLSLLVNKDSFAFSFGRCCILHSVIITAATNKLWIEKYKKKTEIVPLIYIWLFLSFSDVCHSVSFSPLQFTTLNIGYCSNLSQMKSLLFNIVQKMQWMKRWRFWKKKTHYKNCITENRW